MRRFTIILLLPLLLLPQAAAAGAWRLDPDHSSIGFSVRYLLSRVVGRFDRFTAVVDLDEADLSRSKVSAVIDAASISTGQPYRDSRLAGEDFLAVERFPTMTFRSKRVVGDGRGPLRLVGDLTIRGVTREVVLKMRGLERQALDPAGRLQRAATITGSLNRRDYGLTWNIPIDSSQIILGDDVEVVIEMALVRDPG